MEPDLAFCHDCNGKWDTGEHGCPYCDSLNTDYVN